MTVTIVRAVQTCPYFPSQWDAWTDDGRYLYLRYRHGWGSVEEQSDPRWENWTTSNVIAEFETEDEGGEISLIEFAQRAGLTLALTTRTLDQQ